MAILNSIRKRGVFLIIIIALALFSFILADVIRNGGFASEKSLTTVANVNGQEITRDDFMKKVEQAQRNLGENGSTAQAMNVVWDRELRSVLQNQEYDKLGLTAQPDQINASLETGLAANPTFQNVDGVYSTAKVQEYIADVQRNNPTGYQQWVTYENGIKDNILQAQYYNLIKAGMRSTLSEGEQQYRFENDKVNMQFVYVPYTKIPDTDVTISDAEMATYIKANPADFEVEPLVDIQYVSFSEKPSEEDKQAAKADVASLLNDKVEYNKAIKANETLKGLKNTTDYAAFVNANSDIGYNDRVWFKSELPVNLADTLMGMKVGDIYGPYQQDNTNNLTKIVEITRLPDSVQSSHILVRWQGSFRASDAITRSKEAAKKLADSLNALVNKSPSKFEDLATQFSDDKSNNEKGGDLGYSKPGMMVPAYNDFIFDNIEGAIGVVETDFGYHIVKVGEQKNMQKAIKVATVTKEIEASEKTLNDVFAQASKFEVAAQKGDFTEIAKTQELALKPVNKISNMDASIPGVGQNRSIVNWAFEDNSTVGDVKRFSIPDGYVIAQLTRKTPKGLMSVAEASATVAPKLRNKKKAEKIKSSMTGDDLQAIATSQSVTVQTATAVTMAAPTLAGAGAEPKVVGAAFAKAAGETTGLIDGEKGVFKVKVTAVNPAPSLENYATYSNQLNSAAAPTVNTKVYQALKKASNVEDNRAKFF